ncbi:DUF2982 domain-containing protein [Shewanella maritima]|uniref:DUF2982 domain-containing protein n=1 Tax=Shewanella maritima TaxID=2520507 RepID=UPI003734D2A9
MTVLPPADEHHIRPISKRNGITLTVLGSSALLAGLLMFIFAKSLFAMALILFSLGIIGTILGVYKLKEPEVSIKLSADVLGFYHRRGQYQLEWSNIQRVDILRVHQDMQLSELPYVGIKLKHLPPLLDSISPRLATGLLTEQRPLLMSAAIQDEDLQSLEHYMNIEFSPLSVDEYQYKGVLAMFGHRCETLNSILGYHVYIPIDMLDCLPEEFIALVRQWQQTQLTEPVS